MTIEEYNEYRENHMDIEPEEPREDWHDTVEMFARLSKHKAFFPTNIEDLIHEQIDREEKRNGLWDYFIEFINE